ADLLGGEERIEDALLQFLRNTRASIAKRQDDRLTFDGSGDGDNLGVGLGQRIAGIGQQVDEDLFELNSIGVDERVRLVEAKLDGDLPQAELFPYEGERALNNLIDG